MMTILPRAIMLGTLLFMLCACASLESKLIGRWEGTMGGASGTGYYEFNSDHSYTICDNAGTQEGTWRLEDSTLLFKITSLTVTKKFASEAGLPEGDYPRSKDFEDAPETAADIAVKGDKLTMTMEGITVTFTKR